MWVYCNRLSAQDKATQTMSGPVPPTPAVSAHRTVFHTPPPLQFYASRFAPTTPVLL